MTDYLIGLGHRRIGFIRGPLEHGASQERYEGFRDAVAGAGLDFDASLVAEGEFTYRSGLECAETLLGRADRPTAIFASNDDMAVAVIALAHKYNLDVPRDLTVTGFDDTQTATAVWPQLTTVRQPISDMASSAIELLAAELDSRAGGGEAKPVSPIEIRSTVIERDSSRPPAGQGAS